MIKLIITVGGSESDYTRYLDQKSVQITEAVNVPTLCAFNLTPADKLFAPLPQRAYVRYYCTLSNTSLYTGYISSAPERGYISLSAQAPTQQRGQLLQYSIKCTSDEHLLNTKAIPFIPAFVNRTQGQILAQLAEILRPGFFDTSDIDDGDLVPFFEYNPQQSWSEIAKLFGDGSRHRYKAKDKRLSYKPYGDLPLGIRYDERMNQGQFAPKDLNTTVLAVPTVNDVTIIGDTEAGNNREDYILGDGFTGNVPLLHKVFRGSSTLLLQETWNNRDLNTQQWFLLDPSTNFDFSAGALNVIDTGLAVPLGVSYLSMNNGVELAGGLDIQNGEITFNDHCEGVLGGLYTDTSFAASGLISGFMIATSGSVVFPSPGPSGNITGVGGVSIIPWFAGAAVGPAMVTVPGHNYVLQTIVHAPQYTRYTRIYRTLEGEEFGGASSQTKGSITYVVQDYDILAATGFFYTPQVTQVSVENVDLPAFAVYALVNNKKLNCTITNTTLAQMPLGGLSALVGPQGLYLPTGLILPMLPADSGDFIGTVQPWPSPASANIFDPPLALGSVPQILVLGNGFNLQAAQITAGNSSDTLAFYAQSIPAAGTPVRFQSWEAQAAVSRLQVSGSIVEEQFVVGDDGIRSAIVTDLNPLPRTSEDCDNAALAFLKDREGIFYNGNYVCTSLFFTGLTPDKQFWPTVGRFFNINAPGRGIDDVVTLVVTLKITILSLADEIIQFDIGFGADLHLEKVLKNFVDLQPQQVLAASDKANPPNPRFTVAIDNSFLPDLNNVYAALDGITESQVRVVVQDSYFGPIEVRRLDTNWGQGPTIDLVATVSGPEFILPRTQFDQVWYMRPVVDGVTSRRSKVIRVRWPVRPSAPAIAGVTNIQATLPDGTVVSTFSLQFDFTGDMRNIYGFELRAADNATILVQKPVTSFADMFVDLSQTPFLTLPDPLNNDFSLFAYFFNQQWRYSVPALLDTQKIFQGNRHPYIWSPGWTGLFDGEACAIAASFGIKPQYQLGPDGVNPVVSFTIEGNIPPNVASLIAAEPVVSAAAGTGGHLEAGEYFIAMDNEDALGRQRGVSPLSNIVDVTVPASGGRITVGSDFPDGHKSGDIYMAHPSVEHGWHYSGHMSVGTTILDVDDFPVTSAGAPDELLDHFRLDYWYEFHAGIFGVQIAPGGVHTATLDIAGATFAVNSLVGRIISCLAAFDRTEDIPLANFVIASNTATSITVGPNAAGVMPVDLTLVFKPADVVTVRIKPQNVGPDSFGDHLLINQFAPSGLAPNGVMDLEKGRVAQIIYGKGVGQRKGIASNSASGYVLASTWDEEPDDTSVIVITDSLVHTFDSQAFPVINKDSFNGPVFTPNIDNLGNATWLLRMYTIDVNGAFEENPWVPLREGYAFPNSGGGIPGTGTPTPYIWTPRFALPFPGEECDTGQGSFGITPEYSNGPDGAGLVSFIITGNIPPNRASASGSAPAISAVAGSGGFLPSGAYQVAVDNEDGLGRARGVSVLSNIITIDVPNNGTIIVHAEFTDGHQSGDIYIASPDFSHGWHDNGYIDAGLTDFTIDSLHIGGGAPDKLLHHFLLQYTYEFHAGIFGAQIAVAGVTATTLKIAGAAFGVNELAGRVLTKLANFDRTVEIEYLNFLIASNTADTITIGDNSLGATPLALTAVFKPQDVITVRLKPENIGVDSFDDHLLVNCFATGGLLAGPSGDLVNQEVGRVAQIIYGKGKGQRIGIASNSASGYVLSHPWGELPDATSVIIITDSVVHDVPSESFAVANKGSFTGPVVNPLVDNLGGATWLLRVFTVDVNGDYTDNPFVPFREGYAFPQPGLTSGDADGIVSFAP